MREFRIRLVLLAAGIVAFGVLFWVAANRRPDNRVPGQPPHETRLQAEPQIPAQDEGIATNPTAKATSVRTTLRQLPVTHTQSRRGNGRIFGTVLGSAGQPVTKAEVLLKGLDVSARNRFLNEAFGDQVATDSAGHFVFPGLPVGLFVMATMQGDEIGLAVQDFREWLRSDFSGETLLRLERGLTVRGTVRDTNGKPVNAAVGLFSLESVERLLNSRICLSGNALDMGTLLETACGVEGSFSLSPVPLFPCRLYARAEGFALAVTDLLGPVDADVEVVLDSGGGIRGRVVDASTRDGIRDVSVVALGPSERERFETTTDDTGAFTMAHLRSGTYALWPNDEQYIAVDGKKGTWATVRGGLDADIEIQVTEGGTVAGRVYEQGTSAGVLGVALRVQDSDGGDLESRTVVTGADGAYVIRGLDRGVYSIELVRSRLPEGYSSRSADRCEVLVSPGRGVADVDFVLTDGGGITGTVEDPHGAPLSDACVYVDGSGNAYTSTDKDGRFTLEGFAPALPLNLYASADGFLWSSPVSVTVPGRGMHAEAVIRLEQAASIAGEARGRDGEPCADARIQLRSTGERESTTTDMEGRFKFPSLAAGKYELLVEEKGVIVQVVELEPGQDLRGLVLDIDSADLSYSEQPAGNLTISGRVLDSGGDPVPDAKVSAHASVLTGTHARHTASDSSGAYVITGLGRDDYSVTAQFGRRYADGRNARGGSAGVDLVMGDLAYVSGKVVDAVTGKAIPDFEVGVDGATDSWTSVEHALERAHDPEGRFQLEIAGDSATVSVRADDYAPGSAYARSARSGLRQEEVVIKLQRTAAVEGVVMALSRRPVAGASIARPGEPEAPLAHSDAEGRFTITNLESEEIALVAQHPEYVNGTATVPASNGGPRRVEILLAQGGRIEGFVRVGRRPAAGASLGVAGADDPSLPRPAPATTGAYGHYSFTRVPAGVPVDVWVCHQDRYMDRQTRVEEGGVVKIEFNFGENAGTISGRVSIAGRAPQGLIELSVSVVTPTGLESMQVNVENNGLYEAKLVPAGTVTIKAQSGQRTREVSFDLAPNQMVRQDLDLEAMGEVQEQ